MRCPGAVASAALPGLLPDAGRVAGAEPLCTETLIPGPGLSSPPAPECARASDRPAVSADLVLGPMGVRCTALAGPGAALLADEFACRVGGFGVPAVAGEVFALPVVFARPPVAPEPNVFLCTGMPLLRPAGFRAGVCEFALAPVAVDEDVVVRGTPPGEPTVAPDPSGVRWTGVPPAFPDGVAPDDCGAGPAAVPAGPGGVLCAGVPLLGPAVSAVVFSTEDCVCRAVESGVDGGAAVRAAFAGPSTAVPGVSGVLCMAAPVV